MMERMNPREEPPVQYAKTILPLMREVCAPLKPAWGSIATRPKENDQKPGEVVTELDLATERAAQERLAQAFPGIAFAGEEHGGERGERYWLMDPIDGTRNFASGLPGCTSQLALVEQGTITFSVIYDFLSDRMYWAQRGTGAFCNETPLQVSDKGLREGTVGWEMRLESDDDKAAFARLEQRTHMERFHVAGESFIKVATGAAEGYIVLRGWGSDYDFLPGILLVQEAGGVVANVGSRGFSPSNLDFIAANPRVFAELTAGPDAVFPITELA